MAYWCLILASLLSLASAAFHGYAGGNIYGGNIAASDLDPLTQSLSLVSWHIFTIFLIVSAFVLSWVAHYPLHKMAVYPTIAINVLGALLFVALGLAGHGELMQMPGAYLMGGIAALSWMGVK